MRLAILILPFLLAADPAAAEHDRHHRSVPRVAGEVRIDAALAADQPTPAAAAMNDRKPERRPVRVVLPSPFAQ